MFLFLSCLFFFILIYGNIIISYIITLHNIQSTLISSAKAFKLSTNRRYHNCFTNYFLLIGDQMSFIIKIINIKGNFAKRTLINIRCILNMWNIKHLILLSCLSVLLYFSMHLLNNLYITGLQAPYCFPKPFKKFPSKTDIEFFHKPHLLACNRNLEKGQTLVISTVFVKRSDFQTRQIIRSTWASVKSYKNFLFETVFLLGANKEPDTLEDALFEESVIHNDIIVGNFIDSYRNLTYKRLMGSKWILQNCPNAKFILKVDDEWFVDTFRVLSLINETIPRIESRNIGHFGCLIYERNIPPRNLSHKLGISKKEFARQFFPDFCLGPASISTRDALRKEYSVKDEIPFFWNEDVFHTGLLREYYELVNNEEIGLDAYDESFFHAWSNPLYEDLSPERLRAWCSGNETNYFFGPVSDQIFDAIYLEVNRKDNFTSDFHCIWRKTQEVKRYREIHQSDLMLIQRMRQMDYEANLYDEDYET